MINVNTQPRRSRLHTELVFVSQIFGASMLMFTMFRGLFLLVYSGYFAGVPLSELLIGFLHGIRFDAAISAMVYGPLLVLTHLPLLNRLRAFRIVMVIASNAIFFCLFILTLSDLQYFKHAGKRLSYEAVAYLEAGLWPVIQTSVTEQPVFAVIGLALTVGLLFHIVRSIRRHWMKDINRIPLRGYAISILLLPILVVMMRGGLQRIPLRIADSFVSQHHQITQLVANVPYLIVRSSSTSPGVEIMDSQTARKMVEALLGLGSANRPDLDFPLLQLRESVSGEAVHRYNVVIILMESFSAKFTAAAGHTLGATPCFDSLAGDGLLFDRFFATGYRTANGFFSTLTGIPDMASGMPVLRRSELRDSFGSLSVLLHAQGYTNVFIHGDLLDSDVSKKMLLREKFDLFVGKKDLEDCGGPERAWGYDDEYIFERAHRELAKMTNSPFLAYLLTVSNHAPYLLPDERHEVFTADDHPEYKFLNSLHYSDWALGEFFERATKSNYFDSTIFVITADHTHHTGLNLCENQHIPLLIYAPKLLPPEVCSVIGSQTDILPTIAGLLNLPYTVSMGRNLRSVPAGEGFAYWVSGQGIGWIEGDYIATMGTDGRLPIVYDYKKGDFGNNLAASDSILGRSIREKAYAFCQFSSDLLARNRILPPEWIDGPPADSMVL